MRIHLAQREYRVLLEILEMASWVLHAYETEKDPHKKKYRQLEQKLLSYAQEAGAGDLVVFDEKLREYFPTRLFEETSSGMEFVEEFEDQTFWDELCQRLARRDLLRQEGVEELSTMSLEERFEKEQALYDQYAREFETNGLDNVTIGD